MEIAKASSLRPLIYIGIGVLGFGLFLFFALLSYLLSPEINWIYDMLVGIPVTTGSFLILLGTR
jgi:hypothetical protein